MKSPISRILLPLLLWAVGGLGLGCDRAATSEKVETRYSGAISNLSSLLALPAQELSAVDLARMNLLCAQGLTGAEDLDVDVSLTTLDSMAGHVRTESERHHYRYQQHPGEYEHSEGFFRMLMLAVVLREDYGVQYAPGKRTSATEVQAGDGFFGDAHDVFLHGLTGPKHAGTCSSLPVLQVAVGRRLGYPLKLVTTRGHLFVRWEDSHEQFNIEAAGQGVNRFPDDYYRHWPFDVPAEEAEAEGYLQSLSPAGELAVFLSIRAMCLREAGRMEAAAEAFSAAARLAPKSQSYRLMEAQCREAADRKKTFVQTTGGIR